MRPRGIPLLLLAVIPVLPGGCSGNVSPFEASESAPSRPPEPAAPRVRIVFEPATPDDASAAAEYEAIWDAEGARIIEGLEKRSGLRFEEREVRAVVVEGMSSSGFGAIPMRLRSSYPAHTKRGTLVHELGHRLHGRFFHKRDEDHPYLFLYLYDVWTDLFGKEFADEQVKVESGRRGYYDYETAWRDALAMAPEERAAKWRRFLASRPPSDFRNPS